MYDLPVKTAAERKQNQSFHKKLIRKGYSPVQKSVYARLLHSRTLLRGELKALKEDLPENGEIKVLTLSLADFREMTALLGPEFDMGLFADEVLVV